MRNFRFAGDLPSLTLCKERSLHAVDHKAYPSGLDDKHAELFEPEIPLFKFRNAVTAAD